MDQEPEKPKTTFIPPPSLVAPPPPPPSPMDAVRPNVPPPPAPDARVEVHIATGSRETGEPGEVLASFNTRAVAFIIDTVVMVGLAVGVDWLLPSAFGTLVGFAYLLTRDSLPFLAGQSVGKKAMRIQAVTISGKSLAGDWQTGGIRNGVLLIPFFILVEIYMLLSREDKPDHGKRLGDEWAKTKVIVVKPPVTEEEG